MTFNQCQPPPPLKPGDLLRVISPSGALREFEAFERGVEIWRSHGYNVETTNINDRWGYLAGCDSSRRLQLLTAWNDPECRGILCARGGYGSARILEDWTWLCSELGEMEKQGEQGEQGEQGSQLRAYFPPPPQTGVEKIHSNENLLSEFASPASPASPAPPALLSLTPHPSPLTPPKWLIGFSDITCLLWSLSKVGISGVHAPVLTTLASEPEWSIERLFDWVNGRTLAPLEGIGWGGGVATGLLLPANLTVATHLLGTPIFPDLDGVILALEDVTEAPYRIDRLLTQWRLSGAFSKVRGIALGRFSRCEAPPNIPSLTITEVLRDRLGDLNIPIVSDLPFGHDGANAALPVGILACLNADKGTLTIE